MDQITALKRLGLTEYEARAYLSLAKLGQSSVKEVVSDSCLPRNKAYDALQKLEHKSRIIRLHLSPRKYRINELSSFNDEIKELSKTIASVTKLAELPKIKELKDMFLVIKGKKAIHAKIAVQNTKSKKEILGCNNLSRVMHGNIKTMKQAVDRGVDVKMICLFDRKRAPVYAEWIKTGAKIRIFNKKIFGPLLPRITIFDGETARLTIGKPEVQDDENYLTLWTESRAFSQMLKNHFMNMWKKSKPIEKYI